MTDAEHGHLTLLHDCHILNNMVKDSPERLTTVFFVLADLIRQAILAPRLAHGEASGRELARLFSISVLAVSKHLRVLEHANFIPHSKD